MPSETQDKRTADDIRLEQFGDGEESLKINRGLMFSLAANGYADNQIARLTLFSENIVRDILADIEGEIAREMNRLVREAQRRGMEKERVRLQMKLREIDCKLGKL